MVYKWQTRSFKVSAEVVGKEFEKLEKQYGEITAKIFVDAAKPESSPLHELLEWNDTKAAEAFRLHQASVIICCLHITEEETEPETIRAYMNVADNADSPLRRTGSFINTKDAFTKKETRDIILRRAIRELKEIKQKYDKLKELAEVFKAIDKL